MIARGKVPVLVGGAALLAGCVPSPPLSYQPPPQFYSAPAVPRFDTPPPAPSPSWSPVPHAYADTPPRPVPTPAPFTPLPRTFDTDPCTGWWRVCQFLPD